jgi:hypothetical protein
VTNDIETLLTAPYVKIDDECIPTMAAAMWHNSATRAPITRSLIAHDH